MGIAGRSVWKDDSDGKQTEMHSLKQAKRRTERNLLEMQKNVPVSRRREPAGLSFEGHEDAQKGAGRGGGAGEHHPGCPAGPAWLRRELAGRRAGFWGPRRRPWPSAQKSRGQLPLPFTFFNLFKMLCRETFQRTEYACKRTQK